MKIEQLVFRSIIAVLVLTLLFTSAQAVNTDYWKVRGKTALRQGEMENLVMNPEGYLYLGKSTTKVDTDELSLWASVINKDNEVYFGSGSGKVYKLVADKLEEVYATGEILVTSLVISGRNELFIGTIPKGKIFKIDRKGNGELFCTLPSIYIWSLVYEPKKKVFYAATGPDGKIYKIDLTGKTEVFYDSKKQNILCMIFDGKEYLYFGTTNPGILYRISLKGKPEVLADFGEAEIKSLAYKDGVILAAINSGIKVPPQEFLAAVKKAADQPKKESTNTGAQPPTKPPQPKKPKSTVQSSIYKVSAMGDVRELITFNNCYLTDIKVDNKGNILAGTDNTGKVFQIALDGTFSIPFDLEANQVLTFQLDKEGNLSVIGTGGSGAVYLVEKKLADKGSYISEVFDAKFPAQWGNLTWKGKGKLTFQTRSGNTAKPDETWSDWSPELTSFPAKPLSPRARYIQFKADWQNDKDTYLKEVSLAYLITNQQPKCSDFKVQKVPSSGTKSAPVGRAGNSSLPKRPMHTPVIKVSWQANDPDGDTLGYRLYYKGENQKNWILLNPDNLILANEYTWDTKAVPDGKYLIKIEATDKQANLPGKSLEDEKISQPILIDNTRPEIKNLVIKKMVCRGGVEDNLGPIKMIEYAIDGKKWVLVYPEDDILDDRIEKFRIQIPKVPFGVHTICIRAFDAVGNLGVAHKEFESK